MDDVVQDRECRTVEPTGPMPTRLVPRPPTRLRYRRPVLVTPPGF